MRDHITYKVQNTTRQLKMKKTVLVVFVISLFRLYVSTNVVVAITDSSW